MEETESALQPGHRLDRYELLCPIASGGMAAVWLARLQGKRGFEKLVAIKTIRAELAEDERFEEMFLDEARIASGIQHPNVAQIIDLGEENGVLYIVMEWVDGESLSMVRRTAKKRGHSVPLGVALRVMADACAGLHAAHELKDQEGHGLGVIHRDVSPQNILIAANGAVKVIDFGIAKARNRRSAETKTGIVKGKIYYMAPEQALGKELDRRADIWAVGACLLELVTGRLPYEGEDELDVVRKLMTSEPTPLDGTVPDFLAPILARSVTRDPAARFATAAAMQRAIETVLVELGLPSTSEDVATFVTEHLAERATKRHELVSRALDAAKARGGLPAAASSTPDIARAAPSVPSQPGAGASSSSPVAIAPREALVEPVSNATAASAVASLESRPNATRARGGGLVWAILLAALGAAGFFVWVFVTTNNTSSSGGRSTNAAKTGGAASTTKGAEPMASAPTVSAATTSTVATSTSVAMKPIASAFATSSASASVAAAASKGTDPARTKRGVGAPAPMGATASASSAAAGSSTHAEPAPETTPSAAPPPSAAPMEPDPYE
jgi:serine/threonine protein kinase